MFKEENVIAPPNKIAAHEMKEQIIQWLYQGVSVRDVEHRLSQIYPGANQQHLRVSFSTIQAFRKHHLQLEDEVLEDIKEATELTRAAIRSDAIQAEIEQSSAYKDKINAIVDTQLNAQREILKVFTVIEQRIESLYNKLKRNDGIEGFTDVKLEATFSKYLDQFLAAISSYKKYVDGVADSTTNLNVNVSVAETHVHTIREAVREVMVDLDPQLAIRFMEQLNLKMKRLQEPSQEYQDGFSAPVKYDAVPIVSPEAPEVLNG